MKWKNSIAASTCILMSACGGGSGGDEQPKSVGTAKTNATPVAQIMPKTSNLNLGSATTFNASKSYDSDGDALEYNWELIRKNDQVSIPLDKNDSEEIIITLQDEGEYILRLKVSDGKLFSPLAELPLKLVGSADLTARAGTNFTVKKGQVINLNGADSRTLDGLITAYSWNITEKPAGSTATIFSNQRVKTNFVADAIGKYTAELTIENSSNQVAKDTVVITSDDLAKNSSPVAILTSEKTLIRPNEILQIDTSKSYDPDRYEQLSYSWSVLSSPANSDATLSSQTGASNSFSASVNGSYEIALRLTDSQGDYSDATYQVEVGTSNQAPIAKLGSDTSITLETPISLVCDSCFDPEGADLSFVWKLLGKPANSNREIESPTTANATLTPDVIGEYIIAVTVSDGQLQTASNTQVLDARVNKKPIAKILTSDEAYLGNKILLDGSKSYDPEGATLSYEWKIIEQPSNDEIYTEANGKAHFTSSSTGKYVVSLRTNDGVQFSDPKTIAISVKDDLAPVIVLKGENNRTIALGDTVTIDATQSYDPEGTALTYSWSLQKPVNSSISIVDSSAQIVEFTPDIGGIYIAELMIKDAANNTASKKVTVEVTQQSNTLIGTVKGRIVDTTLNGVENATFNINGKKYSTDKQGVFDVEVNIDEGSLITVTTEDERLAESKYVTAAISQQDFIIDMGDSFVPVKQDVDTYLWTCAEYSGSKNVNLRFNMVDTFPEATKFVPTFDQTFSHTVDTNKIIALPSTATFELMVDGGLEITAPGSRVTIYYAPVLGAMNIITICNQ